MKLRTNSGGMLAPWGTALAIIACYGTLAVVGVLSLLGITIAIHEGVWAGSIVLFSGLALAGIILSWKTHHQNPPLLSGIIGVGMIVWTMGVAYDRLIEIAGFAILIIAVVLDWRARRQRL